MKNPKKAATERIHAFLNRYFDGRFLAINEQLLQIQSKIEELGEAQRQMQEMTQQVVDVTKAGRDNSEANRKALTALRETSEYAAVFKAKEPLITVRIATYNKSQELIERAIASVLKQTYQNFEIVIVGDHCPDDTEERIKALRDKRIRFYNFPYRNVYPDDPYYRYLVAGSPGMNLGAYLAKGDWIAPLDDDDEFTEDHLEVLLKMALENQSELVFGALEQRNLISKETAHIWSFPPVFGGFSFQGSLYMKKLNDIFQYDQQSWVVREAGDWNLCRRMLEAGVRMSAIDKVVGVMYTVPHDHKSTYEK